MDIFFSFEFVEVQCNFIDHQYQQKPKVLYTFMPNKSYTYLLNVEPSNLVFLKTITFIMVIIIIIKFTDQNGKPLKAKEDKVNLALLINRWK